VQSWLAKISGGDITAIVACEGAFLSVHFVNSASHCNTRWWSGKIRTSVASSKLFLPEELLSLIESTFCSSSSNRNKSFVALDSACCLVTDYFSVIHGIKSRAEVVLRSNAVSWSAPAAGSLVELSENILISWLLPFSRSG